MDFTIVFQIPAKYPPTAYILFFNDQLQEIASERRYSVMTRSQSRRFTPNDSTRIAKKRKATKFTMQSRVVLSKWKQLTVAQKQEWHQRAAALLSSENLPYHSEIPTATPSNPESFRDDRNRRTVLEGANPRRNLRQRIKSPVKEAVLPRHCCT